MIKLGFLPKPLEITLLVAWVFQASLSQAAFIELDPNATTVANGEVLSIDLRVGGLGNFGPDSLGTFDISVGFDSSVISFDSYSLGGLLGDVGLVEALDVGTGQAGGNVNVAEVSLLSAAALDALQPGDFSVATLNFDVINLDAGELTELSILSAPLLGDAFGSRIGVTETGSAIIEGRSPVPVPGTLLLLVSAFIGWQMPQRLQRSLKI